MSFSTQNGCSNESGASEAEQTLRLIASLPAPEGLADRVQASLHAAPRSARILRWPAASTPSAGWLRGAAAAAIVMVVAGSSWGVYSHVAPPPRVKGVSGPRIAGPGEFSQGGAVRRPQTLQGPVVTTSHPQSLAHPDALAKPRAKSTTTPRATKSAKAAAAPLTR